MRQKCTGECKQIKQNAEYTAEAHHIIANSSKDLAFKIQLLPALLTATSVFLTVGVPVPPWWIWVTVVSAFVTAYGTVKNPLKDYYDHLMAAKNFTAIKHDARILWEVFSKDMTDKEFIQATKSLHDRYNELIRISPPTDDESFEKAREKIQLGVHEPDK